MHTQPQIPSKIRILCLHGYLQSAEIFRSRIGSARKALKRNVEFFFADAPYIVDRSEEEAAANGGATHARSWWTWEDDSERPSLAAKYSGWEASEQAITEALKTHGPIDILLGFSQGASAAALYLAEAKQQNKTHGLKGAVLISGFRPRDVSWAEKLDKHPVDIPALFVCGEKDELVPIERSKQLWETWDNNSQDGRAVRVFKHPGAHMVPTCSGEYRSELLDFLLKTTGRENVASSSANT